MRVTADPLCDNPQCAARAAPLCFDPSADPVARWRCRRCGAGYRLSDLGGRKILISSVPRRAQASRNVSIP